MSAATPAVRVSVLVVMVMVMRVVVMNDAVGIADEVPMPVRPGLLL